MNASDSPRSTACGTLHEPEVEVVRLRRATAEDAATLALVGAATFLEAFTWMLPGADIVTHCAKNHTAENYRHYFEQPGTRITLAVTGEDAPVGYAMVCEPDLPTMQLLATDTELKRIYLFSRFRGALVGGVRAGQALMDAAIADARELGKRRLLLGTHDSNTRAIAFYRRNGFREVGTRTFVVGTKQCCDLIFGRDL